LKLLELLGRSAFKLKHTQNQNVIENALQTLENGEKIQSVTIIKKSVKRGNSS